MMRAEQVRGWIAANWFVALLPLLGAAAYLIARSKAWAVAGGEGLETALLVDACVTVPLLYFLCYRRRLPKWQMALRVVALACGGIYLLGYSVPAEGQWLLPQLQPVRTLGLVLVVGFELWLVGTAMRLVFRAGTTAEQVRAATGAPPLIARLMLIEARFWKAVARFLLRR